MPNVGPQLDRLLFDLELIKLGHGTYAKHLYLEDEGLLRRTRHVYGSMTVFGTDDLDLHAQRQWVRIGTVIKTQHGWHYREGGEVFDQPTDAAIALIDNLLDHKGRAELIETIAELKGQDGHGQDVGEVL